MIYAKLDSPSTYLPLIGHPVWDEAIEVLRQLTTESPLGIIEIRGKDMFVNVHTYDTKKRSDCRFEGHRDTIDVQYIIEGGELVDWIFKTELQEDGKYLPEKDFQYYLPPTELPATQLHLKAGYFGIFFPQDGHRPKVNDGTNTGVLKAVVKINRALFS